jgi:hypothetical protein
MREHTVCEATEESEITLTACCGLARCLLLALQLDLGTHERGTSNLAAVIVMVRITCEITVVTSSERSIGRLRQKLS